jgi:hypothetical protein
MRSAGKWKCERCELEGGLYRGPKPWIVYRLCFLCHAYCTKLAKSLPPCGHYSSTDPCTVEECKK